MGGLGGPAIRAEFQLRREKLKSLGVDTLDDWFAKRGAITEHLASDWFRLTDGPVDSRHTDRTPTHPDWLRVQQAFADWTGAEPADLTPLPKRETPPSHLIDQVIGLLLSTHARMGTDILDNNAFLKQSARLIAMRLRERSIPEEVRRRAIELGVYQP